VVLAEDNEINAMLARTVLEKLGHRVVHLVSGRAVVEHMQAAVLRPARCARQARPHPHGPDHAGTQRPRGRPPHPRPEAEHQAAKPVPILALTANARREDREACLTAGMNGYLSKPFDRSDLEDAISFPDPPRRGVSLSH
jgi:CheY-like chemotaxis protein